MVGQGSNGGDSLEWPAESAGTGRMRSRSPHRSVADGQVPSGDSAAGEAAAKEAAAKKQQMLMEKIRAARASFVVAQVAAQAKGADGEAAFEGSRDCDAETEDKINRWSAARRSKDFATADALRSELRSQGIDTDNLNSRPAQSNPVSFGYDAETEAKIARWAAAKRLRDFPTSDAVRTELRSQGIEVDELKPLQNNPGQNSRPAQNNPVLFGYDAETEAKIGRWAAAKRVRDFATSDAVRTELRSQGIEVDELKPLQPGQTTKKDDWNEKKDDWSVQKDDWNAKKDDWSKSDSRSSWGGSKSDGWSWS